MIQYTSLNVEVPVHSMYDPSQISELPKYGYLITITLDFSYNVGGGNPLGSWVHVWADLVMIGDWSFHVLRWAWPFQIQSGAQTITCQKIFRLDYIEDGIRQILPIPAWGYGLRLEGWFGGGPGWFGGGPMWINTWHISFETIRIAA